MHKKTVKEELIVLICDPVRPCTVTTMNPLTKLNVNQKIELSGKVIKIHALTQNSAACGPSHTKICYAHLHLMFIVRTKFHCNP